MKNVKRLILTGLGTYEAKLEDLHEVLAEDDEAVFSYQDILDLTTRVRERGVPLRLEAENIILDEAKRIIESRKRKK